MLGKFELFSVDGLARVGAYHTAHGAFETPAFMPVGTQGTVKGVTPRELKELGAQIVLSNTYHLHLRPGDELIREHGGLHKFMSWDGPILTDSGGYQVFSLSKIRKVIDRGVEFQSHIDGKKILFTPEKVVQIQENLGVDIMMVLDECVAYPAEKKDVEKSLQLTTAWAKRSRQAKVRNDSLIFGIVQGGMFEDLRKRAVGELLEIGFDAYAIGGLSVGESQELMLEMTSVSCSLLPADKPRYLMGVGTPVDIIKAVEQGIDMFDCVIPTRSARFGRLFTKFGPINIRNTIHRSDDSAIEESCDCYTCKNFSRAYISHLIHAKEVLAVSLASIHNLRFYQRLMKNIRFSIEKSNFQEFKREFLSEYIEVPQEL